MRVMAVRRAGGPDVLELVDVPEPTPGPGQALVEVHAAGVNFMDIGVRQGLLWTEMPYPKVLGVEGAGRVRAVGEGVDAIRPGERVAWVYAPGSYAEHVIVPAAALVPLPDAIDDRTAGAVMMQDSQPATSLRISIRCRRVTSRWYTPRQAVWDCC